MSLSSAQHVFIFIPLSRQKKEKGIVSVKKIHYQAMIAEDGQWPERMHSERDEKIKFNDSRNFFCLRLSVDVLSCAWFR
jgi:hypothetical protein